MTKTYSELLALVHNAIIKILETGQSYTIADRTYTRADLNALAKMEKYLQSMAAAEEAGGQRYYRGVPWR